MNYLHDHPHASRVLLASLGEEHPPDVIERLQP